MFAPDSPTRTFHARWRTLQADHAGLRELHIAITASFTVEPLLPFLGVMLAERGLYPRFDLAPYNQIYQSLLDPTALRARPTDVTLVLPRIEELCGSALGALASLEPAAVEQAHAASLAEIDRLIAAVTSFQRASRSTVVCGNFAPPSSTPLGVLDGSHAASESQLRNELNLALWRGLATTSGVLIADVAEVVSSLGAARAYDARHFVLSRAPFSVELNKHLAEKVARTIAPLYFSPAKVIVLDLDNTLWGGIVGEDGVSGLALGDAGVGAAYVAFQEALLALRAQGVLLCVASKNNEADAWEVFDKHPAMKLRREHIAAWRIDWRPKSESLLSLSDELSVGLDSFVFLDDSPTEREEVRSRLPRVTVPDLPSDVASYVAALRSITVLDRVLVTSEDRTRASQHAAQRARAAARPAEDPAQLDRYLRSLELAVVVHCARPDELPRVAQLTQKTNQFNLTTIRRTFAEIEALVVDPAVRVYSLCARDRFGDYGLTGVLIARLEHPPGDWQIDTLLLSCRVLGRGVETALLNAVLRELSSLGAQRLSARFIPTEKNAPARDFLPTHGFVDQGDGCYAMAPLAPSAVDASHIAVSFAELAP